MVKTVVSDVSEKSHEDIFGDLKLKYLEDALEH
jgi:hypothetical protein